MSITHNQFKNIEAKVFSPDSLSLDKEQLLCLKKELMETHNDAKQNNQILERWNAVDIKLSALIADKSSNISKSSNGWQIMITGTLLASFLAIVGYVIYDFYIKPNLETWIGTKTTTGKK